MIPDSLTNEVERDIDKDTGFGTVTLTEEQFATFLQVASMCLSSYADLTESTRT